MFALLLFFISTLPLHQAHLIPSHARRPIVSIGFPHADAFELAAVLATKYANVKTLQDVENLFYEPHEVYNCRNVVDMLRHSDILKYFTKDATPKELAAMKTFQILNADFLDAERLEIKFQLKDKGDPRIFEYWARRNDYEQWLLYKEKCNNQDKQ